MLVVAKYKNKNNEYCMILWDEDSETTLYLNTTKNYCSEWDLKNALYFTTLELIKAATLFEIHYEFREAIEEEIKERVKDIEHEIEKKQEEIKTMRNFSIDMEEL